MASLAKKKKRKGFGRRAPVDEWTAQRVEAKLLATSFPRVQMVLILSLAALGTFFSSASLVAMGLGSMGIRYALAVIGGYSFFLLLVRLWIAYQTRNWSFGRQPQSQPTHQQQYERRRAQQDRSVDFDLPDLSAIGDAAEGVGNLVGSVGRGFAGGGGEFGGAGASISFGDSGGDSGGGAGEALEALGGADEGLPILLAIIALVGGLVALGFVVYSSPILFAEVLLDVAVVSAVFRKNQRHERGHWAKGVVRRTYVPVIVLAVLAAVFGFAMQSLAPDQHTLGAVMKAKDERKDRN